MKRGISILAVVTALLLSFAENLTDAQIEATIEYRTLDGRTERQTLRDVLAQR